MASQLQGQERRDFWLVCFGQLLVFCGFFAFFQFPLYIKAVGGTERAVGVIMGLTSLAAALLLPWITAMSDRVERKGMMLLGIVIVELGTMLTLFTVAPDVWMAGLMILRGLGMAVYMNASGAYVAQVLPPSERSRWIGINFGFNQVATALGPLLAEIAIRKVGFPYFFFLSTAFIYCGMLMVVLVHRRSPPMAAAPFRAGKAYGDFLRGLIGPQFRNSFFALVLMAGALGAVTNFTATYTQTLGLSSGLFFANYAAINAASRFGGAGLADRYGRAAIVVPMLLLYFAGIFLFSFTTNTPMMLASGLLIGLGFGLANPALLALMLDRAPSSMHGQAIGTFHYAYQVGFLVLPPVFGYIAESVGYREMWWFAALMPLGALAVFLWPERRPLPPLSPAAAATTASAPALPSTAPPGGRGTPRSAQRSAGRPATPRAAPQAAPRRAAPAGRSAAPGATSRPAAQAQRPAPTANASQGARPAPARPPRRPPEA